MKININKLIKDSGAAQNDGIKILLILLCGFIIRLINLNQSLWLDEAISVVAVKSNTYWQLLTKFLPGDVHPPLYYFFLKFWNGIFGYSEIVSRLPSVFFGVTTGYVVYLIGKKISGERVGILAALFWAVNPLAVYYAQEARMYSLLVLLVTMAGYFILVRKWWLFLAVIILAVYTDYLAFLMLPVFWLLSKEKQKLSKIFLIVIVFYIPWLPILFNQLRLGTSLARDVPGWGQVVGGVSLKAIGLVWAKFIIGRISIDDKYLYAAIISVISAGFLYILLKARNLLFWIWFVVPVVLGIIVSLRVPVFAYHRFLFVLPAFVLLLALGAKKRGAAGYVVLVGLLCLAYFDLNPRFWREDWRGAAGYVKSSPGTIMMPSLAQSTPLVYYGVNLDQKLAPTVYLFRYVQEIFDPRDTQRSLLESSGYRQIGQRNFNGIEIWIYRLTQPVMTEEI